VIMSHRAASTRECKIGSELRSAPAEIFLDGNCLVVCGGDSVKRDNRNVEYTSIVKISYLVDCDEGSMGEKVSRSV
jgi:hypothetical protein